MFLKYKTLKWLYNSTILKSINLLIYLSSIYSFKKKLRLKVGVTPLREARWVPLELPVTHLRRLQDNYCPG